MSKRMAGAYGGWAIAMMSVLLGPMAFAQTGPQIAIFPWQEGAHWAETSDEILYFDDGHVKGDGGKQDADVWNWDSDGRIKVDRNDPDPKFVIGYRILSLTVDSDFNAIDGSFWDIALVGAYRLGELHDGWDMTISGGVGSANDGAFSNEDALYGLGAVNGYKKLDDVSGVHAGLRYNGNALVLPDIPLPYLAYESEWSEQLSTVLGLPLNSVEWTPMERLQFQIRYAFPINFNGEMSFQLIENLSLFARYADTTDAFAINGKNNKRIYHELERVSGGIRWVTRLFDASLGVGYAFKREFDQGFDLRETDNVAVLSEEAFMSLKIVGTF